MITVIAVRADGAELVDAGGGKGYVRRADGKRLGGPNLTPIQSILARGYWEPTQTPSKPRKGQKGS